MKTCGQKVDASDCQNNLKAWSLSGEHSHEQLIFLKRFAELNNVLFSKWIARPWLVDLKKSINNDTFKSWLLEDKVEATKDDAYWKDKRKQRLVRKRRNKQCASHVRT